MKLNQFSTLSFTSLRKYELETTFEYSSKEEE